MHKYLDELDTCSEVSYVYIRGRTLSACLYICLSISSHEKAIISVWILINSVYDHVEQRTQGLELVWQRKCYLLLGSK